MSRPAAIGYVRTDVSGIQQQWDEARIRALADRFGYTLLKTVAFSEKTDTPVQRLINVVSNTGAEAVFTPSPDHFFGQVPRELVAVADVNTVHPEKTHSRIIAAQVPRRMVEP